MQQTTSQSCRYYLPTLLKERVALHVVDGLVRALNAHTTTPTELHGLLLAAGDWVHELQREVNRLTNGVTDDEDTLLVDFTGCPSDRTDVVSLYEHLTMQQLGELHLDAVQLESLAENLRAINQMAESFAIKAMASASPVTEPTAVVAPCVYDDKPLGDAYTQTKTLMHFFSGLRDRRVDVALNESLKYVRQHLPNRSLPDGATGWLAVIRWSMIAPTYAEALAQMTTALRAQRGFDNLFQAMDCMDRVKPRAEAQLLFEEAVAGQTGAIVYLPAQMSGRVSAQNANQLWKNLPPQEFPLDTFAIGCLILTHGYRFCGVADSPELHGAGDVVLLNESDSQEEVPRFHCPESSIMLDCTPNDRRDVSRVIYPTGIVSH